jgi:hypothetical protein
MLLAPRSRTGRSMFYAEQEIVGEHSRRVRARKDGEIHGGTEGKCVHVFDIYIRIYI